MSSSSSPLWLWLWCFFIIAISPSVESRGDGDECWGRRIHIRKLPPRFNLDLLRNCSQFRPIYPSFCPHLANHGLGPTTHNRTLSWHRTDPSMLELLFHRRLLDYPCLTPDPLLADAIFLPYYSSLDALPFLFGPATNSSPFHGLPLFDHLTRIHRPDLWLRRGGHDHFLVMARPAWDFSQSPDAEPLVWGTSFLKLPQFYNVSALIIESRPTPYQEQAIPYPTSFHPSTPRLLHSWIRRVRRSRRTALMLFAGGGGSIGSNPNIRRSIRLECNNGIDRANHDDDDDDNVYYDKVCEFVDCSGGVCEHDPIRYMRPMLEANFCLQPPGDTPTRRSTFDSFLAGCIPVFFEDLSARRQYGWHLPEEEYGEFSVTIAKEDVVWDGVRIVDVLRRIPEEEVRRMRERVIELMPRLIYRKHGVSSNVGWGGIKDAFDIAVEGVLERIRNRLLKFNYSA
ncbi:hypothetical protein Syun_012609 [Stephania yunnanensis]|uniref:Exostosin GT47 domain-containing protein n=1 Tax=Stephania yunnanensis TaxID=152371 RepID=A0AAP0K0H6_9MAGN